MVFQPIRCNDPSLLKDSRTQKICLFIPVLGWEVALWLQFGRIGKVLKDLESQLDQREYFPSDAWGTDQRRLQLVRVVADVIKEVQRWPNDHFLPEDPWDLLVLEEEGIGFIEMAHELGKRLDVDLSNEAGKFMEMSLGEVVDYLTELDRLRLP